METSTKGYKVFNPDFTCRNFKFAENTVFEHSGVLDLCDSGFHFCIKASHCFSYYAFDSKNIVCEVEAIGDVKREQDGDSKCCTNKIRIGRRLTWAEVLEVANEGSNNTGHSNAGNRNTGYRNTGYRNAGNSNTGDRNTGVFCTGRKTLEFFNKQSDWTENDFFASKAYQLLCELETKIWVYPGSMSAEEKAAHPSWETVDGYLKDIPFKEAFQNAWHNWTKTNRKAFEKLPNFDAEIFEQITGVKIEK